MRPIALLLLAVLAAACSPSSAATPQPLSPVEFRDAVQGEISRQRDDLCFEKPDKFTLRVGRRSIGCGEVVISTAYQYRQYSDDPDHDPAPIKTLATMAIDGLGSLEEKFTPTRARLVMIIRPSAYAAYLRTSAGQPGGLWKPFVGDLITVLAQKDGEKSRSITKEDLASLGLTESAGWAVALSNLRQQIGPLRRTPNTQGADVVAADSGLALSYLLLPETCASGGPNFDAFAVSRDTLFYADQGKPGATAMLASYTAELVQTSETYSDNLISCIDGRWYASRFNGDKAWVPIEGN